MNWIYAHPYWTAMIIIFAVVAIMTYLTRNDKNIID